MKLPKHMRRSTATCPCLLDMRQNRYHAGRLDIAYRSGKHFLYAGRLEYRKGIHQFIRQMARVWEEGRLVPLLLVAGDVPFTPIGKTIGALIREKFSKWKSS